MSVEDCLSLFARMEQIARLNDEIARCWRLHDDAEDQEMRKIYAGIIKSARGNLLLAKEQLLLLQHQEERHLQQGQQQQQPNQGNF